MKGVSYYLCTIIWFCYLVWIFVPLINLLLFCERLFHCIFIPASSRDSWIIVFLPELKNLFFSLYYITLPTKVHLVKAMVFSISHVWMWELDRKGSWAPKNSFARRHLRVPWTTRRSNQSILKEINPECSLERLMLKLNLQYFDHLIQRTELLENTPMLGKTEDSRKRGRQRMRWLDVITNCEFKQTPGDGEE